MIRNTIFALTAVVMTSPAFAGDESIAFDRAQLTDPAYVSELQSKVQGRCQKCLRPTPLSGSLFKHQSMNGCVQEVSDKAFEQIEDKRRAALAEEAERLASVN